MPQHKPWSQHRAWEVFSGPKFDHSFSQYSIVAWLQGMYVYDIDHPESF